MEENKNKKEVPEAKENKEIQGEDTFVPYKHPEQTKETEQEYSFLQETIKDEKVSHKLMVTIGKMAGYGFIFGIMACLGFFVLKPWVSTYFFRETVTFEDDKDKEEQEEVTEELKETEVSLENYREMTHALSQLAEEGKKSMITLRGTVEEAEEEGQEPVKMSVSGVGVLLADNGQELLILARDCKIGDWEGLHGVFPDGVHYSLSVKAKDEHLNLVVLAVDRGEISGSTWRNIKVAELGNSNEISQGDTVIALGTLMGYENGLGYGVISDSSRQWEIADGSYQMVSTDIPGVDGAGGILLNIEGKVIGVVAPDTVDEKERGALSGLGISDLKSAIGSLVNGQPHAYTGVRGIGVTREMKENQDMPEGMYAKEIEVDSPAMKAGIQRGDIITKIGKRQIVNVKTYQSAVNGLKPGEQVHLEVKRKDKDTYTGLSFTITIESK